MTVITADDITNQFDSNLAFLLSALLLRTKLPAELSERSWADVLGTLARHRMRAALLASPMHRSRRYRLREPLWESFTNASPVEDHVFPLDAWKLPLLTRARDEQWRFDAAGLFEFESLSFST
jgi:hypothetical protein